MGILEWITNRTTSASTGDPPVLTEVIPRQADRIFTKAVFTSATTEAGVNGDLILDRLPNWKPYTNSDPVQCSIDTNKRIKPVEYRFCIDFATQINGVWYARKKMSVLCLFKKPSGKYLPVVNAQVAVLRQAGSSDIQFLLPNGNLAGNLHGNDRPLTNSQGIVEFTIVHQTKLVTDWGSKLQIIVTVPQGANQSNSQQITSTKTIDIEIFRNSRETDFNAILSDPDDIHSSQHLWSYQPAALETAENQGITNLQEITNEVASRHRGITAGANGDNFSFLTLNGVYDDNTKHMLGKYLQRFPSISPVDYPYNLSQVGPENTPIGPDPAFLMAIQEDYAPFDPTLEANRGCIVDRRLLIGAKYDITPGNIDGLWELYKGVVQVLQSQMREYGQSYLDCDMFWLHRPEHGPYSPATDKVFGCKNNNIILLTSASNTAAPLVSNGSNVVINDGEHFLVSSESGNWVSIRHSAGIGWVQKNNGVIVLNDRGAFRAIGRQIRNHGIFGIAGVGYTQSHTANGVAYTYGGKQTPDEWKNSLLANTHASPAQIVNYSEYDAGCMFGEIKSEYDAGDMTHKMAGCDCSGFVQNCIIHSFFPGTTTLIVPTAIISSAWLGSSQFIGNNLCARPIPRPLNDQNQHWIRGTDIIQHPGHIVMVAEDNPTMLNDAVDFKIMQECGGAKASDTSQFRRKSVRSPFTWWSATHAGFNFGKVFIWR